MPATKARNIISSRSDGTDYFDLSRLKQLDNKILMNDRLERYRYTSDQDSICLNRWIKLGFLTFDIKYNNETRQAYS